MRWMSVLLGGAVLASLLAFLGSHGVGAQRRAHRAARVLRSGCADGQREAFRDLKRHPEIAGCAGGFDRPGIYTPGPGTCGLRGGDDGPNPGGAGCSAEDLCAEGFHVCRDAADVASHSPRGCAGAADAIGAQFFATRQSGPGCAICALGGDPTCSGNDCRDGCAPNAQTTNDLFGCGTAGDAPWGASGGLDRFSNDQCRALPAPWQCAGDGTDEARVVTKPGPAGGGVLCCRD